MRHQTSCPRALRASGHYWIPADAGMICFGRPRNASRCVHTIRLSSRKPRQRLSGTHMWTAPDLQGAIERPDRIACDHMSGLTWRGSHFCRLPLQTSHPAGIDSQPLSRIRDGESSKRTTPLCMNGAIAPCRTTMSFPRIAGLFRVGSAGRTPGPIRQQALGLRLQAPYRR